MHKFVRIGSVVLIGVVILGGAYFLFKRLLHDRDSAMAYHERPIVRHVDTSPSGTRTVKNYSAKDLEEARKKGTLPPDMRTASPQSNAANDAVQRNLQTLEEINRINQMNQRMMEEQQRASRQNKN